LAWSSSRVTGAGSGILRHALAIARSLEGALPQHYLSDTVKQFDLEAIGATARKRYIHLYRRHFVAGGPTCWGAADQQCLCQHCRIEIFGVAAANDRTSRGSNAPRKLIFPMWLVNLKDADAPKRPRGGKRTELGHDRMLLGYATTRRDCRNASARHLSIPLRSSQRRLGPLLPIATGRSLVQSIDNCFCWVFFCFPTPQ
jgi:hypothetical protein